MPSLDDPMPQSNDNYDWQIRQLENLTRDQGTQIDELKRLLNPYHEERFSAFDESGNPFTWSALTKRSGSWPGITEPPSGPFAITVTGNPNNPSQNLLNVGPGDLLKSLEPNDWMTITGLQTNIPTPATGTAGQVLDIIVLVINVTSYAPTAASIQTLFGGGTTFDPTLPAWDPSTNSYVWDDGGSPPQQIGINFLIGYTVANAQGSAVLFQSCTTDLLINNTFIDNEPAIFPVPAPYGRWGKTPS